MSASPLESCHVTAIRLSIISNEKLRSENGAGIGGRDCISQNINHNDGFVNRSGGRESHFSVDRLLL